MVASKDKVFELEGNDFNDFIKEGIVLVDFYGEWCMPCIMMGPILDEISEKMKDKIKVGKVNVGNYQELAQKFNVTSIPNMIVFKDGVQIDQFIGAMNIDELEEKLGKHIK